MNKLYVYLCVALLPAILANPLEQINYDNVQPEKPSDEEHNAEVRKIRMLSIGKPDVNVGALVDNWKPDSGVKPEELGSYLEGDILTVPNSQGRNGIISTSYRWPNAVVYYKIQGAFNSYQLNLIYQAMNAFQSNTCIRFRPFTGTSGDHIIIKSDNTGCWSAVGRIGGAQNLNLQAPGCVNVVGTPIHELMHAVGFFHEQSRLDRDSYVNVLWQNIQSGQEHNFNKMTSTPFGVSYDYGSVMHYSLKAFSRNGQPTLQARQSTSATIGQTAGLSASDIRKLKAMYNC
ncbi:zinc metalloproteinase nas-4-like [Neocloeon triangulifer]|uniref:zinc metalloproteinase nas-4-like n=1 Tax=Neocloeon triangulifer TaxID=2078957 RepID=UPI00286EC1D5|nr:zinc metalloproteinase nas-4-like [Neocloeon triangulifer]